MKKLTVCLMFLCCTLVACKQGKEKKVVVSSTHLTKITDGEVRKQVAALVNLGEVGCPQSFTDCPSPYTMERDVLEVIQAHGLTFEQTGISPGEIRELAEKAELKIANQKLVVLQKLGGAHTPQQLKWLSDVCWVVYLKEEPYPLYGNPGKSDLKKLAPANPGFISGCHW